MRKLSRKHALVLIGCAAVLWGGVRLTLPPVAPPLWKVPAQSFGLVGLRFAADGKSVVGGNGQGMRRWNAADGAQLGRIDFGFRINTSILSPDGEVAVGLTQRVVHSSQVTLRSTRSGTVLWQWPLRSRLKQTADGVSLFISPDNKRVCVLQVRADRDDGPWPAPIQRCDFGIYNVASGRLIKHWQTSFVTRRGSAFGDYDSALFSPDSRRWLWLKSPRHSKGHYTGACEMHDVLTGKSVILPNPRYVPGPAHIGWMAPTFSGDGRLLAAVWTQYQSDKAATTPVIPSKTIFVWDVPTRKLLWTYASENFVIDKLAFSPDAQKLAAGGTNITFRHPEIGPRRQLMILETGSGGLSARLTEETPADVLNLLQLERFQGWRPLNRPPQSGHVWNPPSIAREPGSAHEFAWSPDSRTLVTADGQLKMWCVP